MDIYKLKYRHYKTSFYKCLNEVKTNFVNEWIYKIKNGEVIDEIYK